MGLLEKRAVKAFQEGAYISLIKEINILAGFEVTFDVSWDKIAHDEYSHMYEEAFSKVFFLPVIGALKEITCDDMGKEALKATLKKIVITDLNDVGNVDYAYSFTDGTLTIDHSPFTNIDNVVGASKFLSNLLMKHL